MKHFYGTSPKVVENQLYIALATYCLLLLIKLKTGYGGSLLAVNRLLIACMCEPFESFIEKLLRKPKRTSRGRRKKVDHDAIYQETLRQVIADEADYLNDCRVERGLGALGRVERGLGALSIEAVSVAAPFGAVYPYLTGMALLGHLPPHRTVLALFTGW